MALKKLIFSLIPIGTIYLTIAMLTDVGLFLNPITLIVMISIIFGLSMIYRSPKETAINIFSNKNRLMNNVAVEFIGDSFILAGVISTFIGMVLMLANLDDQDMLIPGFAIAFLSTVQGFVLKFLIDPFKLNSTISGESEPDRSEKTGNSSLFTIIGIISILIIIAAGILLGGSLMLFVMIPAVMLVLGGGGAAVLIRNSIPDIKHGFKGGFGGIYSSLDEVKSAVNTLSNIYNRIMGFGFIGLLIGIFVMFIHLDEPGRLGPGMALSLISIFYALVLAILLLAFMAAARRQGTWFGTDVKPDLFVSPVAGGLISIGLVVTSFTILLASFSG